MTGTNSGGPRSHLPQRAVCRDHAFAGCRDNICILDGETTSVPATETHGRDAGDILNTVLDASSRPEEAAHLFDAFNRAVDEGRHADANCAGLAPVPQSSRL